MLFVLVFNYFFIWSKKLKLIIDFYFHDQELENKLNLNLPVNKFMYFKTIKTVYYNISYIYITVIYNLYLFLMNNFTIANLSKTVNEFINIDTFSKQQLQISILFKS